MSSDAIESLLAEASRLYNEGSYRQAIQKWQEVLALDPANQKARESVKIAALLSDTWSESGEAGESGAPGADAAEAPSAEEQELQDALGRIRGLIETRNFETAMSECEALAGRHPESEEIKQLIDQARSGLESAPFIRVALERAARELKAGQFQTVEVLCRKVLALDAGNRQARTYLLMAQRRTAGAEEVPAGAEEQTAAPEISEEAIGAVPVVADEEAAGPPPEDSSMTMAIPVPVAPEEPPQEAAPSEEAEPDPLAALAAEMGGDISPMDLAGGDPAAAMAGYGAGEGAGGAAPGEEAAAYAPPPTPDAASEVDASQIDSIPLGAPEPGPPQTRRGEELVREGSIYQGPEGDEGGAIPSPGHAAAGMDPGSMDTAEMSGPGMPPPDLADPAAAGPPPARRPAAAGRASGPGARHSGSSAPAGAEERRPRAAPRPVPSASRAGTAAAPGIGARVGKALISLLVKVAVLALGVGLWILREEIKHRFFPSASQAEQEESTQEARPAPRPGVVPVSGPGNARAPAPNEPQPSGAPAAPAAPLEAADAGGAAHPATAVPPAPAEAPVPQPAAVAPAAEQRAEAAPELPDDPVVRQEMAQKKLLAAQRLINQGKAREGREFLAQALELDPVLFEARDLLEKIDTQLAELQRFDDDVRTVNRSFEEGDYHSALWKLYRLADAFPTVRTWNYNIAASWYNWGVKLLKAGNCREAMEKLDDALKINPNDREAIRQRTVAERYLARPKDTAYFSYVEALNLRPLKPMVR